MTAIQRPTDSVLRRHFEFGLQTEWPSAAPQDSMLIRHHEQMRAAWREGAEQTPFEALGNSPISLAVERHPLAIHLEARPIPPNHVTEFLAARLAYKIIAYTQR